MNIPFTLTLFGHAEEITLPDCCASPEPGFEVGGNARKAAPFGVTDIQRPIRRQAIACVNCRKVLIELRWRVRP